MSAAATQVALLRGINVGGKARVEMPRLKAVFAALGCADVATYINSGNVLFRDARTPGELVPLVEAGIAAEFGFDVPVLLRDLPALRRLCAAIPSEWTNDARQKTDVLFLRDGTDGRELLASVAVDPALENVLPVPGALVWNVLRENARRSGALELVGTPAYRELTIRNVNTVRKLLALMKAVAAAS